MFRKPSKRKDKSYKVKFSGRYKCTKDQVNAYAAFQLLRFCNKQKDSARTTLVCNSNEFYVGKSVSLVDIKKKIFHNSDVQDFYIFKETPQCAIIVEKEHDNLWMSYFKFLDDSESDEFVKYLQDKINSKQKDDDEAENETGRMIGGPNVTLMTLEERIGRIYPSGDSMTSSLPSYRSRTYAREQLSPDYNDDHYLNDQNLVNETRKDADVDSTVGLTDYVTVEGRSVERCENNDREDGRGSRSTIRLENEYDEDDEEHGGTLCHAISILNEEEDADQQYVSVDNETEEPTTLRRCGPNMAVPGENAISRPRRTRVCNMSDIYMHEINKQGPGNEGRTAIDSQNVVNGSFLMICERKFELHKDSSYDTCESEG